MSLISSMSPASHDVATGSDAPGRRGRPASPGAMRRSDSTANSAPAAVRSLMEYTWGLALGVQLPGSRASGGRTEQERIARQRPVLVAIDDPLDRRRGSRGTVGDQQRQVMLFGRMRARGIRRL